MVGGKRPPKFEKKEILVENSFSAVEVGGLGD